MIITKMVMENFKSYAGTREIGPFHKVSKVKKGKKREKSDRWNYFFSYSFPFCLLLQQQLTLLSIPLPPSVFGV